MSLHQRQEVCVSSFSVSSDGKGEFQHNAGPHVWRLLSLFRLAFGWKEFWTFKPFAELSADLRARLRRLVFVWDRRRETDSAAAKIKAGHLQNTLGRRFNARCQGSGIAEEHGQRQNYPITQYNTASFSHESAQATLCSPADILAETLKASLGKLMWVNHCAEIRGEVQTHDITFFSSQSSSLILCREAWHVV